MHRVRAEQIGDLELTDICGPMNVVTSRGAKYLIFFKDDSSGYRIIYYIKQKSEATACMKKFLGQMQRKTRCAIKVLRSNRGGKYTGGEFQRLLNDNNIKHELTCAYTPEQNGAIERENQTIMESVRSMLHKSQVHGQFWREAATTTVYLLTRMGSKTMGDITPYEAWYKQKLSVLYVIIFGSDAYMHVPKQLRQKLDSKCKKCILMGYSKISKAYRLWDNQSRIIKESRDVTFDEGLQGNEDKHDIPTTQGVVFINEPPLQAPMGVGRGAIGIFIEPVGANAGAPNEQRAVQRIDLTPPKDNDDPSSGSDDKSAENLTNGTNSEFEVVMEPLGGTLASWKEITTEYYELPTLQRHSDFGEDAHTEVTNDISVLQMPAQEPPPFQNEPKLRRPPTRYADYYAYMASVENM